MTQTQKRSRPIFDKDELVIIKMLSQSIAAANQKVLGKGVEPCIPGITMDIWTDVNLDSMSLYMKLGNQTGACANIMYDLSSPQFSILHKVIAKNQKPLLDYFKGKLKWWEKLLCKRRAKEKLDRFNFKFGLKPGVQ